MQHKPKKRLGQNFLIDKNIQKKIVACLELQPVDTVLEIGSGRGELSVPIAKIVKQVLALEIDASLCPILKYNLNGYANARVLNQDILKFNLNRHFKHNSPTFDRIKVVGNIPYYISSPIIAHLFKYRESISAIFITVQKEFAIRIAAHPGSKDYGAFSCFVQYYAKPKVLFKIKKTCFLPSPKVDSVLLRLDIRRGRLLSKGLEKMFFRVIRASFNKRRKTLRNSLKGIAGEEKLEEFFKKSGFDRDIRPESLALEDFAILAKLVKN